MRSIWLHLFEISIWINLVCGQSINMSSAENVKDHIQPCATLIFEFVSVFGPAGGHCQWFVLFGYFNKLWTLKNNLNWFRRMHNRSHRYLNRIFVVWKLYLNFNLKNQIDVAYWWVFQFCGFIQFQVYWWDVKELMFSRLKHSIRILIR